jgi:hypothetical protein
MTARSYEKKKKLVGKTVMYGAITAILYAAVFSHASTVVEYFARGGYYAALPVATVFVFSFAHGAFSHNLWSALGIEAITKPATARPTAQAPRPAQRPRPRVRVSV